jgi:hypothetical protein
MQHDVEYARFLRRRETLTTRLAETGAELDKWIADKSELDPDVTELARLEGLLATRSDLFAELKKLDDAFVDYLLVLMKQRGALDEPGTGRDSSD